MLTGAPFSVAVMPVIVEPATVSLKTKSEPPPAPVSTNLFPLFSTTSKSTPVPLCVNVTVPKSVAVPHPPERWQLVKVNVSALAGTATAKPTTQEAAISTPLPNLFNVLISIPPFNYIVDEVQ
jgi:hypothetical protein